MGEKKNQVMFDALDDDEFDRFAAQIAAQLLSGVALQSMTPKEAVERWVDLVPFVREGMWNLGNEARRRQATVPE